MVLVISNPCKIKFKSIFNVKLSSWETTKRQLDDASRNSSQSDNFSFLPEEVLLNIFVHLGNPAQFICTSRYLASLGCSPRFIAHWICQRYGRRCALYCALTKHSEICDDRLIRCLLQLRVHVSRYLLQMFIENYRGSRRTSVKSTKSSGSGYSDRKLSGFTEAISQIPFSGYATVINAAWERYDDVFPSEDNDFVIFTRALEEGHSPVENEQDQQQLKQLVEDYQFLPLPLPEQIISKCFIKLAAEKGELFEIIAQSFRVDKHARYRVWERAILDVVDYSFSATETLTARKVDRLHCISKCVQEVPLGGMKEECELFILALTTVLKRYPNGYVSAPVITKAFHLVDKHIKHGLANWITDADIKNNDSIPPAIQEGFSKFKSSKFKSSSNVK